MDIIHPALTDVHVFLLVFARVSAIIALMPIFGSQNIPVHLKAGLSIIMAILVMPFVKGVENIAIPSSLLEYSVLLLKELLVGVLIGFAMTFIFIALQFAGRLVDVQMGFAMVELVDPFTDTQATVQGQLNVLVFTLFFLLINGHYFLLLAVEKSFELIPLLGAQVPSGKFAYILTDMSSGVFVSAIKLAAPVYVTLVLTSLALGVVARTVPQMNVFFVGMPLKIGVGIGTTIIVLPVIAELFRRMTDGLMRDIWRLLYLMA